MEPNAPGGPKSRVQLFISGRKLKDLDVFSKSDPICYVHMRNSPNHPRQKIGETEMLNNNLNPDFARSFQVDFFFEKEQELLFEMWDDDGGGSKELIGRAMCHLGDIVGARGQTYVTDLRIDGDKGSRGKLIVRADILKDSNIEVKFSASASGLRAKSFCCFGTDAPQLALYRERAQGEFVKVFTTATMHGTLSP